MHEHIEWLPNTYPAESVVVNDHHYILARSSLGESRARILKHNETFGVFDRHGDMRQAASKEQGLYHHGTRFLSRFVLRLGAERLLLLGSTLSDDNVFFKVDLMNADLLRSGEVLIHAGVLHVSRLKFLWMGTMFERIRVTNFGLTALRIPMVIEFSGDFSDIFEVRGTPRARRGNIKRKRVDRNSAEVCYFGLDGVQRRTLLHSAVTPDALEDREIAFIIDLQPKQSTDYDFCLQCLIGDDELATESFDVAAQKAQEERHALLGAECSMRSTNQHFDDWLQVSCADLGLLLSRTSSGIYPYAGVPWYSCPFGRDGIITALQCLWANAEVAKGVLSYLSATQSTQFDDKRDAEPGKILHESRLGEMAALKEIPFGRYYGTIDATLLYLILAGRTLKRTGEVEFLRSIWGNILAAIEWMRSYGDCDGDGYIEYASHTADGLSNQGWKDSSDSIFHSDGTLATGPIALCEVQAYAYEARLCAAFVAETLGHVDVARSLQNEAQTLKIKFENDFWCDDLGTYVIALDGNKKQCRVKSSNAGHCLFSGIASEDHAKRVAHALLSSDMFTGWGIRTLSSQAARYNPMSYHNGTVWPHDNAIIAEGLSRYNFKDEVLKIFTAIFDVARKLEGHRLPELIAGFDRATGIQPSLYPVACSPQAWAVGSLYMLLSAALGIHIQAPNRVEFRHPKLPPWLSSLKIQDLRVGRGSVDLLFTRHADKIEVDIVRRDAGIEVSILK